MPKVFPAEFRRRVLALVEAGCPVREVAADLEIAAATIYRWRAQAMIDAGAAPGSVRSRTPSWWRPVEGSGSSSRRWRSSSALLRSCGRWCTQELLPGDRRSGHGGALDRTGLPVARRVPLGVLRVENPATVSPVDPPRVANRPDHQHPHRLQRPLRRPMCPRRARVRPRDHREPPRRGRAHGRAGLHGLPARRRHVRKPKLWTPADLVDRQFRRNAPNGSALSDDLGSASKTERRT
jgi:hypothetical protein